MDFVNDVHCTQYCTVHTVQNRNFMYSWFLNVGLTCRSRDD